MLVLVERQGSNCANKIKRPLSGSESILKVTLGRDEVADLSSLYNSLKPSVQNMLFHYSVKINKIMS